LNNVLRSSLSHLSLAEDIIQQILDKPESVSQLGVQVNSADLAQSVVNGYRAGFKIVFYVGAGLAGLAFILAWFLMPQVDLTRPDDQKLKEEGKRAEEERKNRKGVESDQAA
jgi:hypothetical protein